MCTCSCLPLLTPSCLPLLTPPMTAPQAAGETHTETESDRQSKRDRKRHAHLVPSFGHVFQSHVTVCISPENLFHISCILHRRHLRPFKISIRRKASKTRKHDSAARTQPLLQSEEYRDIAGSHTSHHHLHLHLDLEREGEGGRGAGGARCI